MYFRVEPLITTPSRNMYPRADQCGPSYYYGIFTPRRSPYLIWPLPIWFGSSHYKKSQHRGPIKHPSGEAKEVNQRVDVSGNNHNERDYCLKEKSFSLNFIAWLT